ncbi:MAG: hypothetical protein Q4P84_04115, partial [Elusimicrobiales bacterium]|nr:hypothetical protein [Elusimicrobiales bacterium]
LPILKNKVDPVQKHYGMTFYIQTNRVIPEVVVGTLLFIYNDRFSSSASLSFAYTHITYNKKRLGISKAF